MEKLFIETLSRAGTHIMGRTTYLDMAQHWPSRSTPTAKVMNSIPKVVFSHTLEHADWPESRISRGDTAEEIAKVQEEPGGEIVARYREPGESNQPTSSGRRCPRPRSAMIERTEPPPPMPQSPWQARLVRRMLAVTRR